MIDPADLDGAAGAELAYVEFTHPLCADCNEWERRLRDRPEPLVTVDVRERPELARKYGITIVPTVVAVAGDGSVLERLAP
jgi:thioredoxin-like negative regulator of GroEL